MKIIACRASQLGWVVEYEGIAEKYVSSRTVPYSMKASAETRYAQVRGSSMQATMMTSGYRKFSELSTPPVA